MSSVSASIEPGFKSSVSSLLSSRLGEESAGLPVGYDRRADLRLRHRKWASLLALDGSEMISCTTDNIGPGGMHVTVPVGYGFAVGQRYEVLLSDNRQAPLDEAGESQYATVVRTQIATQAPAGQVGVGLRFDTSIII
ncbi:MAG TPA: PilZ domain-containing protein [Phycisphaerae bacterium]|jgi:hypothetical protein